MFKTFTHLAWVSLILLLLPNNAHGQRNYVKGYVILPSQDTLPGLIDDQNRDRNPKYVNFKQSVKNDIQRYSISQLEGFGIDGGDIYQRSIVTVDKTPTRYEELLHDAKPVLLTDTVFLLELVRGKMNLSLYTDENHRNHFYIKREKGHLEELIQRNYLANKNGQQMLGTLNQYKDQLQYSYLTECSDAQIQFDKISYTRAALTLLIEKYNACINPSNKTNIEVVIKPTKVKYHVTAGANNTLYFFKGKETRYVDDMDYKWQPNPLIGLAFQIIIPRNRQKWSIYNELAWKRNYSKGAYAHTDRWIDEKSSITIKANYVGLTTLLRYSWMNKNYQPFINAGFAINRAISIDMQLQTQRNFYTYQTSYDGPYQDNHRRNVEIGVVSGAGVKIKKMAAEIRYERANGFLDLSQLSVEKKMLVFLISYNLD